MTTDSLQRSATRELASRDEVKRRGQVEALVKLLRERMGQWVPLPEVIAAGGCQYSARIHYARHTLNLRIENKREAGGHSFFRLLPSEPPGFLFPAEPLSYRDPEEAGQR